MAKSRIGPFALEAPLSERSSTGQVFRAIHLEQRKLAALRLIPLPLGLTPESREAFASQLEQLKQLRHPNIARCYGGGFDARNAYLAYELVDGESLDKLLERRGRLAWETALDHALQIAEGLQYAHQMGWIHARLRPEKILVTSEGRVKISDWRRDAISTMVDSAPPQVQQLVYTAPEIFAHQRPDEKSDLYSLGGILFSMLTGIAPFTADSMPSLAQRIATEVPPSASSLVLDCPVWLNAIVEQLLAKDARFRPFSATALQLALKEAQRRQAQGDGVLQHAAAGFSPLQMKLDRAEAEKVMGIKPQKKQKPASDTPFFEQPWVLLTAFILAVGAVVWFLLPLSEDTLRARAERQLASEEWIDWNDARDVYLMPILERYPEGKHADWAQEQIDWVDMQEVERRIDRNERLGRSPGSEAEKRYVEAKQFEDFGDRATALDKYRAIIKILSDDEEDRPIINLARRQMRLIESSPPEANQLQKLLLAKLEEADLLYKAGKVVGAKQIWESILNLYEGNQELLPLVERASQHLAKIKK